MPAPGPGGAHRTVAETSLHGWGHSTRRRRKGKDFCLWWAGVRGWLTPFSGSGWASGLLKIANALSVERKKSEGDSPPRHQEHQEGSKIICFLVLLVLVNLCVKLRVECDQLVGQRRVRMRRAILAVALAVLLPGGAHAGGAGCVVAERSPAKVGCEQSFRPSSWAGLDARPGKAGADKPVLNLQVSPTEEVVEEITVYGRRHAHELDTERLREAPVTIGPAAISGRQVQEGSFSGLTITAAVPMGGVPGLEATLNLSGGHDQLNASSTATSAAATAGLRLRS